MAKREWEGCWSDTNRDRSGLYPFRQKNVLASDSLGLVLVVPVNAAFLTALVRREYCGSVRMLHLPTSDSTTLMSRCVDSNTSSYRKED